MELIMRNQRLQDLLVFVLLFVPALLVAWFHYACFPTVVDGFRQWAALPEGIELLRQFGFILYLPPLAMFVLYLLSWRFATLRSPVIISLCGGLMVMLCLIYAGLLVTPALAHGVYLKSPTTSHEVHQ
jgi:hypothetical protein